MEILKKEENKNIVIINDIELRALQNDPKYTLSKYGLRLLRHLAYEKNRNANEETRNKFYNCDVIGCAMCSRRGACWSVVLAQDILKDFGITDFENIKDLDLDL